MGAAHLNVIREALAKRAQQNVDPTWQWKSTEPYRLSVALCCVELGDAKGLGIWIKAIQENISTAPLGENEPIVSAAKHVHARWCELEEVHGVGALLDYQRRLRSSPPHIVGIEAIENAIRFQKTKSRVPGDPYWALQFV